MLCLASELYDTIISDVFIGDTQVHGSAGSAKLYAVPNKSSMQIIMLCEEFETVATVL